jgi:hypothetical protein
MIVAQNMILRGTLLLGASMALASAAGAETRITPYIEVGQILDAELNDGGEVLTYSAVAVGVDATVRDRRTEVQASYRYERYIPWDGDMDDQDIHSGLLRGRMQLVPDLLSIEGGAIASRTRVQYSGASPQLLNGDPENMTQVYSIYAGPSLATRLGILDVTADYRFGFTKVDDEYSDGGGFNTDIVDRSTVHNASAGIGLGVGYLPFGWNLSAGWLREDANQLDQRFDAKYARLDVTVPIARTVALVGGIGYEDIEQTQADFVRDATGAAVIGGDGRFVEDKSKPRLLAYDEDGLIYDAGVVWRPNRRTRLEARAGYRYGGDTYTGSFTYQTGTGSGISINVYDGIQSFGRLTQSGLQGLPTRFDVPRDPFGNNFTGCVFGAGGAAGGCLGNAFQSANNANFRNRGVTAIFSGDRGLWSYGVGAGYSNRKYVAPNFDGTFSIDGVTDESWMVQANLGRRLTPVSSVEMALYGNWFDSGTAVASDVRSAGATGTYTHQFGRLSAQASVGLDASEQDEFDTYYTGTLLLGARYSF